MCGIAGILNLSSGRITNIHHSIKVMNFLLRHRGPDGEGIWIHPDENIGFGHRRLSIIDLTPAAAQPMKDTKGNWIVFNGEIYNYIELREELGKENFSTTSDTEVILHAYARWGSACVNRFRGMFAFALWDEKQKKLFCARDRFGIKPFYYTQIEDCFYFASEIKALLPFVPAIETDLEAFKEYLAFQFCLEGKTLFKGIKELLPAHTLEIDGGSIRIEKYWEVYYEPDFNHTSNYFEERLKEFLEESIDLHLRSDVPVGSYVSGGLDSSTIAAIASPKQSPKMIGFTGKFSKYGAAYDESHYAEKIASACDIELHEIDITVEDFVENIRKVIYHLDYPVAGPGAFSQYMVSRLAAQYRKVVLGGQGGDEIFGGYTRYLIAYFEQCIKGAIDGTMESGNFIVTYQSIIPNLKSLQSYKPLLQEFWREGLFEDMDLRYFRLINRAPNLNDEVNWKCLEDYHAKKTFKKLFNCENVNKTSYFDRMTHFDFKTLLPALLQVEDRMSMAHGLESRVPLLDYRLVELSATIPSNIKFEDGMMKHIFRQVARQYVPAEIINREDKMGFPTPINEWMTGEARDFIREILSSPAAQSRTLVNNQKVLENMDKEPKYGRKLWGFLCLELWQQEFHDKQEYFKKLGTGEIAIE
jgi:asparagine synthase (glutamine-hydrolysing)